MHIILYHTNTVHAIYYISQIASCIALHRRSTRDPRGRPGSRKHRRYTHSVDLVHGLRRVMAARGEDDLPSDVDAVEEERNDSGSG